MISDEDVREAVRLDEVSRFTYKLNAMINELRDKLESLERRVEKLEGK